VFVDEVRFQVDHIVRQRVLGRAVIVGPAADEAQAETDLGKPADDLVDPT
jgi:hypothetical protein